MKLYEIANKYEEAYQKLTALDIDEKTISDTLESIEGEFEEKAINTAKHIKNIQAELEALKNEIAIMTKRKKSKELQVTKLLEYLKFNMGNLGIKKIPSISFDILIKKSPSSVMIIDENEIPDKYKAKSVLISIDKKAIKKDGGCDGVEIKSSSRIEIK